jgi:hypothetical protein
MEKVLTARGEAAQLGLGMVSEGPIVVERGLIYSILVGHFGLY